jgi:hypothetical protein
LVGRLNSFGSKELLFIDESNPVRVIDAFVDALDLGELGFDGAVSEATGRPS